MSNLTQKTIFVTGASGFVGGSLCRQLHQKGATIHAISRQPVLKNPLGLHWHQGDLQDFETVRTLIHTLEPDIVFHLASYVSGSRDLTAVPLTFHSNLTSTVNLLTAVTEVGCQRCILAGSLEEPDEADGAPIPCSPYAAAKWASHAYGRMFHALYQLPVVTTRLFMIYGPHQQDLKKLIPYTILSLLRGETPQFSSGERPVDWIFIDDVVDGLITAALAPDLAGHTVELGSGKLVTVRNVIQQLADAIAPDTTLQFGALSNRPMERIRAANIERTEAQMGWRPKTSLAQGLQQTIDWYRNHIIKNGLC